MQEQSANNSANSSAYCIDNDKEFVLLLIHINLLPAKALGLHVLMGGLIAEGSGVSIEELGAADCIVEDVARTETEIHAFDIIGRNIVHVVTASALPFLSLSIPDACLGGEVESAESVKGNGVAVEYEVLHCLAESSEASLHLRLGHASKLGSLGEDVVLIQLAVRHEPCVSLLCTAILILDAVYLVGNHQLHTVAHHSEGRQSRLTPYDAGLALRQSNARSISLIQYQNCKVLLKILQT